jgi:hypothetical protein
VASGVGLISYGTAGAEAQVVAHVSTDAGGTYVALSSTRLADTRGGSGFQDAGETLGAGARIDVQVNGRGTIPPSGVSAVVLNLTAVVPSESTYLTVYPEGSARPAVASLNVSAEETLANLVTVPVGTQGGISIYNHSGNTNVVVDVEGYYTASPQATGLYNPVDPIRLLGTLSSGASIGAGVSTEVRVNSGTTGVPVDASAVVLNVTASTPTASGFLTVYPAPSGGMSSPPTAANVNFSQGQTVGNRVIVPVGANGQIEVYNHAGSARVDVDLYGYYTGSAGELGSAFTPLSPARFTDTRVGSNGSVLGADTSETFTFTSEGIPSNATALVSNVTVISGPSAGYLTIYPVNDSSPPAAGDVNFPSDAISQNLSLAPLNSGSTKIFNSSAVPVNIVIDAFGYFAPPPPAVHVVANPASLPADGTSTSALTISVTTGSGVAFDDPVTLSTAPSTAGSCGIASATGSTNASGQVTSTYTASVTAGTCTITATEANGGTTGSAVITQTSSA